MDIVRAMKVFVKVVDADSISAAASAFDLSPAMVGNHLQALEQQLGSRLLERTTRRQHLTQFGRLYYERCMEILGLIEDADTLALEQHQQCKGQLRITAPTIWSNVMLVPALADYFERYPEVDVEVVASDRLLELAEHGFDAAIRLGNQVFNEFATLPLRPYRLLLCAAPAYLARHGMPENVAALAQHTTVNFGFPVNSEWWSTQASWRLQGEQGEITVATRGRLTIDSTYGVCTAALAGMGIAMLPEVMVRDYLDDGRLVPVLPQSAPRVRPVTLLYRKERRIAPKLRSFIDFVEQRFGVAGSQ